jgi:YVTN family beta-propeller protein
VASRCLRAVLVLVAVAVTVTSGQWLEATVAIPDTFGGLRMPNCLAYDSADNVVFVAGESTRTILVLDAHDGHRLARIPFTADIRALCYNSVSNKIYAAAADHDQVAVIDAGTMRVVETVPAGTQPVALEYDPALNRVYCANLNSHNVTVIDGAGDSVLATVPVEQQPSAVCWNPTRNVVYCANTGSNTVSVIDAATNTVVAFVPTGSAPIGFVYNSDLNKLYTANYGSGTVTVIDGLADTVLANIGNGESPCKLCYNPQRGWVFVADEDAVLMVIDCAVDTLLRASSFLGIVDVAYNPVDNHVYAAYHDYLLAIDCDSGGPISGVIIGDYVCAVGVADSGRRAFGAADEDAVVGAVDCASDSLLALIATDPYLQPTAVCFNPATDRAYCAVAGANVVMVIDGEDNAVRRVVPSGMQPWELVHDPSGNKVYCANAGADDVTSSITVIDGAGDSVLRTIETGPWGPWMNWCCPQVLCLNATGDRLYEALYSVLVVDASADTVVCDVQLDEPPYALCYEPAHDYLYARTYDAVDVIDAELNLLIAQVDVGRGASALCYVPVGAKIYTADLYSGTVSVIAGERPELVTQIDVGGGPYALCRDSKDNKVYCVCRDSDWVAVIDADADTVVATLRVGGGPCALYYDSLNNSVLCACAYDNSVAVIDCEQDSVVTTIAVGEQPIAMAWNPIDMRTYVANREGLSISVLRDSLRVGLGGQPQASSRKPQATVVRSVLFLNELGTRSGLSDNPVMSRAVLLDISGRTVVGLKAGANDVRHLAPGVYFVREEPQAANPKPQAIRKIVVAR